MFVFWKNILLWVYNNRRSSTFPIYFFGGEKVRHKLKFQMIDFGAEPLLSSFFPSTWVRAASLSSAQLLHWFPFSFFHPGKKVSKERRDGKKNSSWVKEVVGPRGLSAHDPSWKAAERGFVLKLLFSVLQEGWKAESPWWCAVLAGYVWFCDDEKPAQHIFNDIFAHVVQVPWEARRRYLASYR